MTHYDAILILSFGGPESHDDVIPFLENVLRGKNVPHARMLEVAEHYYHFDGISPINEQNRALIAALRDALTTTEPVSKGLDLPIYWGNRNWHPLLADALQQMHDDGVKERAGVRHIRDEFVFRLPAIPGRHRTGPSGSGRSAPQVHKLRAFYNHPGFIAAMQSRVRDALADLPDELRSSSHIVFTAHSIPLSMADSCPYVEQLEESSRLVMEAFPGHTSRLVYQSRSGPPSQPWLEPDICDYLRDVQTQQEHQGVVIVPIGFISDHMEVLFDLDTEARELCDEIGLDMVRSGTAGTHPQFVGMMRDLISERVNGTSPAAMGKFGPRHDVCPVGCCPSGKPRPATSPPATG